MAKAATKKVTAKKPAAAKAAPAKAKKVAAKPKEKAAPASEVQLLEANTFVKFTGYVSEMPEEEQAFEKGDTLYVIGVNPAEGDTPTMYDVIPAAQVATYIENPESEEIEGGQCVVQEITALGGRALTDARDTYLPIPSMGKLDDIIEEAEGDLVNAARGLFNDMEQNSFYLGGVLAKVRREGSYLAENGGDYEGETAWNDFCEAEFNFSGAKGGDLARQYTTFAALPGFDPSKLADIGWSKLREIQRYVTEDNVDDLLDTARTSTKRELSVKLVEQFAGDDNKTAAGKSATRGGGTGIKMLALSFKLPEDSHAAVNMALKEAIKTYGVNTEAEALERIIVSWAEEHVGSATKQKQISNKIEKASKATAKKAPAKKATAAAA